MRKTKITGLFKDALGTKGLGTSYLFHLKNPKDESFLKDNPTYKDPKELKKLEKEYQKYRTELVKDLKLGLKKLEEAKSRDAKDQEMIAVPYFLWLDYFPGGEALLILGTHPKVQKDFNEAQKKGMAGQDKQALSFGFSHLDENNVLQFVPEKIGMKVKPKPLVEALKKDPIKKSGIGFWSKRKVTNVIISEGGEMVSSKTKGGEQDQDSNTSGTEEVQENIEVLDYDTLYDKWGPTKIQIENFIKSKNYDEALRLCREYKGELDAWLQSEPNIEIQIKTIQRYQRALGGFIVTIADKKAAQKELGLDDDEQNLEDTPITNVSRKTKKGQLESIVYTKFYQFEKGYSIESETMRASFAAEAIKRMDKWIEELGEEYKGLDKDWKNSESKEIYQNWLKEIKQSRRALVLYLKGKIKSKEGKVEKSGRNNPDTVIEDLRVDFNAQLVAYKKAIEEGKDPFEIDAKLAAMERLLLNAEDAKGRMDDERDQQKIQRAVDQLREVLAFKRTDPNGLPEKTIRRFWQLVQVAKAAGLTDAKIPEQYIIRA